MKLTQEHIEAFREIHRETSMLDGLSPQEVGRLAQSVAQYYCTLFEIYRRLEAEGEVSLEERT